MQAKPSTAWHSTAGQGIRTHLPAFDTSHRVQPNQQGKHLQHSIFSTAQHSTAQHNTAQRSRSEHFSAYLPALDTVSGVQRDKPAAHPQHIVVSPRLRGLTPHQPSEVANMLSTVCCTAWRPVVHQSLVSSLSMSRKAGHPIRVSLNP